VRDVETNEVFAAKIVVKASVSKPRAHAKLKSEIAIHRSLDHEKVVQFVDYFEDSENVYMILELCPNRTLNEFLKRRPNKRLSEAEAMYYLYDLIIGLKYLHKRRVLHRDLKLGNLFLDCDMGIKIADFGLASQLEHDGERKRTICGTPNYIAPEILEAKQGHSYEVDIWAIGVILYTMIFGRPPFETSDVKATYRRIRYNRYSFPDTTQASEPAKDLIASILRTDPRARPSLDKILASPWFQCSRLPPQMPVAIANYAGITPRSCGVGTARSETPERGVVDFARIDSPAARFPLSDRSPSMTPLGHGHCAISNNNVQDVVNSNGSPRVLLSKQGSGACIITPRPGNGRPPLAQRCGNDENIMPTNVEAHVYGKSGKSPTASQATLGGGLPTTRSVAPSQSHASSHFGRSGSTVQGIQPGAGVVRATPNTAVSPRQPQSTMTSRPGVSASSPREGGGRSSPRICASKSEVAGMSKATLVQRGGGTNPVPLSAKRLGASPPARLPGQSKKPVENNRKQTRPGESNRSPSKANETNGRRPKSSSENAQQMISTGAAIGVSTAPSAPSAQTLTPHEPTRRMSPAAASIPQASDKQLNELQDASHNADDHSSSQALAFDAPHRGASAANVIAGSVVLQTEVGVRGAAISVTGSPKLGTGLRKSSSRGSPKLGAPMGSLFDTLQGTKSDPVASASSTRCPPSPNLQAEPHSFSTTPELWVVKWVDYSSKYGVGYILSDGSMGVYFNDSTKILLLPEGCFDYVTRRTQERGESRKTHTFDDYPEDLNKKVTLLKHFKSYLLTSAFERDGATTGNSSITAAKKSTEAPPEPGRAPFVRKWTRNKNAIMFQLSNKIVQVIFLDGTEAILSSNTHSVIYVDKKGQVSSYPLSGAFDVPNAELAKRLRYIKDTLVNLMGPKIE
jgi:serine/threonine protein kinase